MKRKTVQRVHTSAVTNNIMNMRAQKQLLEQQDLMGSHLSTGHVDLESSFALSSGIQQNMRPMHSTHYGGGNYR